MWKTLAALFICFTSIFYCALTATVAANVYMHPCTLFRLAREKKLIFDMGDGWNENHSSQWPAPLSLGFVGFFFFFWVQPPIGLPVLWRSFCHLWKASMNRNGKCYTAHGACVCSVAVADAFFFGFSAYTHTPARVIILNMYEIYTFFCHCSLVVVGPFKHNKPAVRTHKNTKYEWIIYILQITKKRIKSKHSPK